MAAEIPDSLDPGFRRGGAIVRHAPRDSALPKEEIVK